ncbi:MAG: glycosyltransferase family 4 protein [Opitutaceae bacterium]
MRKPQLGFHSFERLFRDIRKAFPSNVEVRVVHSWFHSRGVIRRVLNCLQAFFIRADVVHITGDIHYLAPVLINQHVVLTIHDLAPLHQKRGWARKVFKHLWYTLPIRCADYTTTISAAVRQELLEVLGTQSSNVSVVPNCISSKFIETPKGWSKIPIILMVGTKANKNLERMFEALKDFQIEVRIIGRLSKAQSNALAQSQVAFTELGRLTDEEVLQAYRDCDLVAFASTYEGFGLPILEAQATGRPVLTSDILALSEVAGEGASLVNPLDVASIRQGFEQLLHDESYRKTLVQLGAENVARFLPDNIAQKYAESYQQVLVSN